MIVGSTVHPIYIAHGFTYRLTQTDPDGDWFVRSRHAGYYLQAALQFFSKIKKDGRMLPVGARKLTDVMIHKIGLSVSRKKQMVCALYQLAFLLPDDACGR